MDNHLKTRSTVAKGDMLDLPASAQGFHHLRHIKLHLGVPDYVQVRTQAMHSRYSGLPSAITGIVTNILPLREAAGFHGGLMTVILRTPSKAKPSSV